MLTCIALEVVLKQGERFMSVSELGPQAFKNIQQELADLSKNNNLDKGALQTLEQRLESFLFYGNGIDVTEIAACQMQLDQIKQIFQRQATSLSSQSAPGQSPTPPAAPLPSRSLTQIPSNSESIRIPLHSPSGSSLRYSPTAPSDPPSASTTDLDIEVLNGVIEQNRAFLDSFQDKYYIGYFWTWFKLSLEDNGKRFDAVRHGTLLTNQEKETFKKEFDAIYDRSYLTGEKRFVFANEFTPYYAQMLEQRKHNGSSPLLDNPAYLKLLEVYDSRSYDQLMFGAKESAPSPTSSQPKPSDAQPPNPIIEQNRAFLDPLQEKYPIGYFWVWLNMSLEDNGKRFDAVCQGTHLLTEQEQETFKKEFDAICDRASLTGEKRFDFRAEFVSFNQQMFKPFGEGKRVPNLPENPIYLKLLKIYDANFYAQLMKEKKFHPEASTSSHLQQPVEQVIDEAVMKENLAFLDPLRKKFPIAYFWAWFEMTLEDNGRDFIAATKTGTHLLSAEEREQFNDQFWEIFYQDPKFDFHQRFIPYYNKMFEELREKSMPEQDRLSVNPVFHQLFELFKQEYVQM